MCCLAAVLKTSMSSGPESETCLLESTFSKTAACLIRPLQSRLVGTGGLLFMKLSNGCQVSYKSLKENLRMSPPQPWGNCFSSQGKVQKTPSCNLTVKGRETARKAESRGGGDGQLGHRLWCSQMLGHRSGPPPILGLSQLTCKAKPLTQVRTRA